MRCKAACPLCINSNYLIGKLVYSVSSVKVKEAGEWTRNTVNNPTFNSAEVRGIYDWQNLLDALRPFCRFPIWRLYAMFVRWHPKRAITSLTQISLLPECRTSRTWFCLAPWANVVCGGNKPKMLGCNLENGCGRSLRIALYLCGLEIHAHAYTHSYKRVQQYLIISSTAKLSCKLNCTKMWEPNSECILDLLTGVGVRHDRVSSDNPGF